MAILSIQSHVVYGYAGNTAAVFPLQRLGREVWAINTVEFSNHTGYGAWRGQVLDPGLAGELVEGLADRNVLGKCEAVLSGYMGDAAVGKAVLNAVSRVREAAKTTAANAAAAQNVIYCCDPVMGDVGRGFYVKPGIPEIFKNEVVPLADIVTPNQFELEALTGMQTTALKDARTAIAKLHASGPGVVLVTSYIGEDAPKDSLEMLASDGENLYKVRTPSLPFTEIIAGSGDATTAVFLSRYLETRDVKRALELTAASIYSILEATFKAGSRELLLIAAQKELESPSRRFNAEKL
jgi:pyridoxine kinase